LAVVLGVLPGLTTTPAAPAPERPKKPAIYALVYVGLGKNDPDNAKRIADAIDELRGSGARGAVRDPKVNALPVVQNQEKKLGWIERDKWAQSKTRAVSVEGTAVVRVWFTDGKPEEQVLIVNAIARDYAESQQRILRDGLKGLERRKANFRKQQEDAGARVTEEDEKVFRKREEAIRHPPQVMEWANLPEKP
jgi:hypothetical protein